MRSSLFQAYIAKFSHVLSYDQLTHLYNNDRFVRDSVAESKWRKNADRVIAERYKKLVISLPLPGSGISVATEHGLEDKQQLSNKALSEWNTVSDSSDSGSACSSNGTRERSDTRQLLRQLKRREQKDIDLGKLLAQLVGVDRNSSKSIPAQLSQIMRKLSEIESKITTLSEKENRVRLEAIYMQNVPGTSSNLTPRTTKAVAARVEPLLNAKLAYEEGEVVEIMRELQQSAQNYWAEHGSEPRVPWRRAFEPSETAMRNKAFELRTKTLSLFTEAIIAADKAFTDGCLKKKRFELSRTHTNSGPSLESQIVNLDATEIIAVDDTDWLAIMDEYVEVAYVSFAPRDAENGESHGKLVIKFNCPKIFTVAADPTWRPNTRFESETNMLGSASRDNQTQLSNRHTFLLKYVAHTFVHIIASINKNMPDAGYNHPSSSFVFQEIKRFFEPFS